MADRIVIPTTSAEIAQDYLDDFDLEARAIGVTAPPVQPGTDAWLHGQAMGKLGILTMGIVAQAETDSSVLDATGTALDQIREALGLPIVSAKKATGKIEVSIPSGSRTIADGEPGKINGIRYLVNGTHVGLTDGGEVSVISVDAGSKTNAESGEEFEFDSAPFGVKKLAKVSASVPITGGTDKESDEDKRARCLNRLQNTPAGGNPGHVIEVAKAAQANVQDVYVYPALGGPGSAKVVVTKAIDADDNDFSRVLDSAALAEVRNKIQAELPTQSEIVVTAAADETTDVSLTVDIPDSVLAGGDGTGWTNETPWPDLVGADTYVAVTTMHQNSEITVTAWTTTSPVAGQTGVGWWAPGDQQFRLYLVTELVSTGGAGPYTYRFKVDRPMVDSDDTPVAVGDYICPAATNLLAYGDTWRKAMGTLGPGENTSDTNRLPRSQRYPKLEDGAQADLNARVTIELLHAHDEIRNVSYSYRSTATATVPAAITTAPNVLVLDNFGIYPE